MPRDGFARALRRRSGSVETSDPIAFVLNHVLQNFMPANDFEQLIEDALNGPHTFTDGWSAAHAKDAARRLRGGRR